MSQPLERPSQLLFEAAFRENYASLHRFLRRRLRSDADAHDLAQEAYLSLLRYRENQDQSSLRALLFRIATNLLGMRARMARARFWANHHMLDEEVQTLPAESPSQEQRLFDQQQLERLMEAIDGLPTRCQQVFVLSRFHDMSYPEIAARCGITVKMVEKHIAKALAICRAKVGGEPR